LIVSIGSIWIATARAMPASDFINRLIYHAAYRGIIVLQPRLCTITS